MDAIDVRVVDQSRVAGDVGASERRVPAASGRQATRVNGQPVVPKFRAISERRLDDIPQLSRRPEEERRAMRVVSSVLPFRTNEYVIDLIDWSRVPDDPIYQMTFPQRDMLDPHDFDRIAELLDRGASRKQIEPVVDSIRTGLNPHPAGQRELNIPTDGQTGTLEGIQHKYRETVLFFPSRAQTCHAYCTFCFRWAQFVGKDMKIYAKQMDGLHRYLSTHPEVTDVLMTGGDPMVMKASVLSRYIQPILESPAMSHVRNIRIGTKSLTFWPYRFVTDPDADELLRLLERIVESGRHLAIMAHFNHWRELSTDVVRTAIRRLRDTGAVVRAQAPLLKHINDDSSVWRRMWEDEVRLGIVPYYMFVERDTGAKRYFEVPLARAQRIYADAIRAVSGLARTARGPSMSAAPGKVEIVGVQDVRGEKVFVLRFLQGRNPDWVGVPFFAAFDSGATWLDQLKPAFGEHRFFFEDDFESMLERAVESAIGARQNLTGYLPSNPG